MLYGRFATHEVESRATEKIKSNIAHHEAAEIQQVTFHNGQLCLESMVQEGKKGRLLEYSRSDARRLIVPYAA